MDDRIGEHFETRDWREAGRVILVEDWDDIRGKYRVRNVTNPNNPGTVGRCTYIKGRNLAEHWKKVSH